MIYILSALSIFLTATTRFVAFYWNIPAVTYLALLPFIMVSVVLYLRKKGGEWCSLDSRILFIILFPILWSPLSLLTCYLADIKISSDQFLKTIIWDSILFLAFFSLRFWPIRKPEILIYFILIIIGLSVPLLYLQQFGLIDHLYSEVDERASLSGFQDQFGESRARNSSFYGNWHDAAQALIVLLSALYAALIHSKGGALFKSTIIVFSCITFVGLLLTSARAEIILCIFGIVTWHLFTARILKCSIRKTASSGFSLKIIFLFCFFLIFIIILVYNSLELIQSTIIFSAPDFITRENRFGMATDALSYLLLSDLILSLFGWGLGSGGMAVSQGQDLLPINAVDNVFIAIIANYGIIGFLIKFIAVSSLLKPLSRIHRSYYVLSENNTKFNSELMLSKFCLVIIWIALLSFFIGESVVNRIYLNMSLFVMGASVCFFQTQFLALGKRHPIV